MTKTKSNEFKTMISQMEQDAMSDKHKCTRTCNKIRTNYAKDKKKHKLKRKCHEKCEKKRMKTVKNFHKKYPKEYKIFVKNLGGGGKEIKYVCYDGIGSNKTGTHTEKEFLKLMQKNRNNFNGVPPKNIKTVEQWIKWSGAIKGKCKTPKKPITRKEVTKLCEKGCKQERNKLVKSLKAMDKILKVKSSKKLNENSLKLYDETCLKTCVDVTLDPKKMKKAINEMKKIKKIRDDL
jgi:hypothetical protein